MATFLRESLAILISATIYHEVQRALENAEYVPLFMKTMSDSRNITLLIQCTFLGAYLQAGRAQDAACATGLLLLTIHVSFLYNNMSPEVFQDRITTIGPAVFTFFQTIPNVLVWMLAILEVIRNAPNVGVGVVCALLPCAPLAYHVGWEVLIFMKKRNRSSSNETADNGIV